MACSQTERGTEVDHEKFQGLGLRVIHINSAVFYRPEFSVKEEDKKWGLVARVSPCRTLLSKLHPSRPGKNRAKLFVCSFSLQDACLFLYELNLSFREK